MRTHLPLFLRVLWRWTWVAAALLVATVDVQAAPARSVPRVVGLRWPPIGPRYDQLTELQRQKVLREKPRR